jgi:gamma-glutamyltranspeptidase/glutathione hydrolase
MNSQLNFYPFPFTFFHFPLSLYHIPYVLYRFTAISLYLLILLLSYFPILQAQEVGREAIGKTGMVVAGNPDAVRAGIVTLQNGGNAADAAVAVLLVLSVKQIGAFCPGGEVPLMFYNSANQQVTTLSGQGAAPLNPDATEWFMKNGIPGSNIKAAAVPAAIDLCVQTLRLYGTRSFSEVAQPILKILEAGGPSWYIDTSDGDTVDTHKNWYYDLYQTFLKLEQAEITAIGNRLEKLQAVSNRFYRGDIADSLNAWYIAQGGFLRKHDLIAHVTRLEPPVDINYHGYSVYKCGPWTQGPYLLQALRLLESYNLKNAGQLSSDYIHLVVEAMKLAMADRDAHYGDPLFNNVPMLPLLSDQYTLLRGSLINLKSASHTLQPGDPWQMKPILKGTFPWTEQGGTTTLCVADRWGNVVAATPSGLGSTAGSGGSTGIIHGTRLVSLNTWKGHPNCVEPGKRPRITLTPTLVLKDNKPVMAISVAGGDLQDQVTLQLLLDYIEFAQLPSQAVKIPRFSTGHHIGSFGQDKPNYGSLTVQQGVKESVINELANRGHQIRLTSRGIGGAAMLVIDPGTGMMYGAGSAALGINE